MNFLVEIGFVLILCSGLYQRWSPRGHILMFLASKPQALENCSVLGSTTAVFFELLKFCRSPE